MKIEKADIHGSEFLDVNLAGAKFIDVNLSGAVFDDVNLTREKFHNINCSHVSFEEACYEGMTIDGIAVTELLRVYRERAAGG